MLTAPIWMPKRIRRIIYALTDRRALIFEPNWFGKAYTVRSYTAAGLGRMYRVDRGQRGGRPGVRGVLHHQHEQRRHVQHQPQPARLHGDRSGPRRGRAGAADAGPLTERNQIKSSRRLVTRARLHSAQAPRMMNVWPLAWNWCCRHTSAMAASMAGSETRSSCRTDRIANVRAAGSRNRVRSTCAAPVPGGAAGRNPPAWTGCDTRWPG